jgi:hypothetical protein
VLEHLPDKQIALENAHAALETRGRAVILVPQHPGLYGSLDVALEQYDKAGTEGRVGHRWQDYRIHIKSEIHELAVSFTVRKLTHIATIAGEGGVFAYGQAEVRGKKLSKV